MVSALAAALFAALSPSAFQEAQLGEPAKAQEEPQVDRSGEPFFREVLQGLGKVESLKATIVRYQMDAPGERGNESWTLSLWYQAPKRYRVYTTAVMGESQLHVSDGSTRLRDTLSSGRSVTLEDTPEGMSAGETNDLRSSSSLLVWMLDGDKVFDKIVAKDGAVTVKDEGSGRVVEFRALNLGQARLTLRQAAGSWRPTAIQIERVLSPGESGRSSKTLQVDEVVSWDEPARFEAWVFDVTPPSGFEVRDRRKRKAAGAEEVSSSPVGPVAQW